MAREIMSFGYKHGKPPADFKVFDTRQAIRNPWRIPELRKLTGKDPRVQAFIEECQQTSILVQRIVGKSSNGHKIAIGCHGGKHRSVALAELVYKRIVDYYGFTHTTLVHRDIDKG